MKIKEWIIGLGSLLFAWLFYNQGAGLNCAIFAIVVAVCLLVFNPSAIKTKGWLLSLAALLVSAVCMVLYGNTLCFLTLWFSLLLLSAYSSHEDSSAVLNFVQAWCSLVLAIPEFFRGWYNSRLAKNNSDENKVATNWLIYIVVGVIFMLFVAMYAAASRGFTELLKNIDLKFISFGWIMTAVGGFFILGALIKHYRISALSYLDVRLARPLMPSLSAQTEEEDYRQKTENKTGTLLLVLLNLLLLTVNVSDIVFLANGTRNTTEINYSEMVHEGVGALILSIISAVGIILFFFRGRLNFDSRAKVVYTLALVWMAQNLLLAITAGYKNYEYIDMVDGLTYKRIGVYFYLLLSAIGLFFTAIKVMRKKPNWYLVRVNFVAFFMVMVMACPINWDALIVSYNMEKATNDGKDPDIRYLLTLRDNSMQPLMEWVLKANADTSVLKQYSVYDLLDISHSLRIEAGNFISKHEEKGWQSYVSENNNTYKYLKSIDLKILEGLRLKDSLQAEEALRIMEEDRHNRNQNDSIKNNNNNEPEIRK